MEVLIFQSFKNDGPEDMDVQIGQTEQRDIRNVSLESPVNPNQVSQVSSGIVEVLVHAR